MSPAAEIVHRPKKAAKKAEPAKKKAVRRAEPVERRFSPGDRVRYTRRPVGSQADKDIRYRCGFATVEYEWLSLDVVAVKVRLDNGKLLNLFPEFGDKVALEP